VRDVDCIRRLVNRQLRDGTRRDKKNQREGSRKPLSIRNPKTVRKFVNAVEIVDVRNISIGFVEASSAKHR